MGLATFVFLVPEAVLGSESAAPAPKYASFSGENNDKALDGMRYGNYPIFKPMYRSIQAVGAWEISPIDMHNYI